MGDLMHTDTVKRFAAVRLVEFLVLEPGWRRELRAGGEADDADLARIDAELRRVRAHDADRLLRVVHGVGLRVVSVLSKARSFGLPISRLCGPWRAPACDS